MCKDLVAHDSPGSNPFRELIPIATEHPFLLHILIATSAIHLSNICHPETTTLGLATFNPSAHLINLRSNDGLSRKAFVDALSAKQRAISYLRIALDSLDSVGSDLVLIAALFFVNFELLDLGKSAWKAHLQGASRLMALLASSTGRKRYQSSSHLLDCVLSDFVM